MSLFFNLTALEARSELGKFCCLFFGKIAFEFKEIEEMMGGQHIIFQDFAAHLERSCAKA